VCAALARKARLVHPVGGTCRGSLTVPTDREQDTPLVMLLTGYIRWPLVSALLFQYPVLFTVVVDDDLNIHTVATWRNDSRDTTTFWAGFYSPGKDQ
jgi:hypothetical protein